MYMYMYMYLYMVFTLDGGEWVCIQLLIIMQDNTWLIKGSLVLGLPRPTSKRWSGTVASNSWSKRQTSFPLKKYILYNERPF